MSNPAQLSLATLRDAVEHAVAFRCRRRLQPAGGEGDKVFPPTFAGARYAIEKRHVPGRDQPVTCVLLDSVQSQANRMEQALQDALDAGTFALPHVVVDFSGHDPRNDGSEEPDKFIDPVGKITSLQVPHRLTDAILRDSVVNGVPFRQTPKGRLLNTAHPRNATPVFDFSPTALLFGMWDSTGPKGGLGAKFERAIVSEVVGVGATWEEDYRARGVRRDPLEIRAKVKVVQNPDKKTWRLAKPQEKGAIEPSKINHSSVPFESGNSGLTIEYAMQTTTLSLVVLRRLVFPLGGVSSPTTDVAARTVLAALGLGAATLAFESGMGLRSRCLLWPDGPMVWELLNRPGEPIASFAVSSGAAIELFKEAVDAVRSAGFAWPTEPFVLEPSADLVELVRRSQQEATKEEGDASGG